MSDNPLVLLPLLTLLFGAFMLFLVSQSLTCRSELLALLTTGVGVLAGVWLAPLWRATIDGRPLAWGSDGVLGVRLQVDPSGLFMAALAVGLGSLVALYSAGYMSRDSGLKFYYPLLLLLMGGIVGIALAADLFNLYLFCELMSVSSYVLVAFRQERGLAIRAAFNYLLMGGTGSALILLAITMVYRATGQLDLTALGTNPPSPALWLSLPFFLVGFGIKAALVPLHAWLPDAHSQAPSGISAMLSGVVIQSGLYALLKVMLSLPAGGLDQGLILTLFALLSVVVGTALALAQEDIKRMLACSSIVHIGIILLGLGLGTDLGFQAALYHLLNHALTKGGLFLCAGMLISYTGTREIEGFRGLARKAPAVVFPFIVTSLSIIGIPLFNGFISKYYISLAAVKAGQSGVAVVVLLASVVAAAYYLRVIRVFFTKPEGHSVNTNAGSKGVSVLESIPVYLLALGCLVLGLLPSLGLYLVAPAARVLLSAGGPY